MMLSDLLSIFHIAKSKLAALLQITPETLKSAITRQNILAPKPLTQLVAIRLCFIDQGKKHATTFEELSESGYRIFDDYFQNNAVEEHLSWELRIQKNELRKATSKLQELINQGNKAAAIIGGCEMIRSKIDSAYTEEKYFNSVLEGLKSEALLKLSKGFEIKKANLERKIVRLTAEIQWLESQLA